LSIESFDCILFFQGRTNGWVNFKMVLSASLLNSTLMTGDRGS